MSIKLLLLPPHTTSSSSSPAPLKIKVLPSTKISALVHTYLVKSNFPLHHKSNLEVWLNDEELELGATVAEEQISSGEKLRIVVKKPKVDAGKRRAVEVAQKPSKRNDEAVPPPLRRRVVEKQDDEEDVLDEGPDWDNAFLLELDQYSVTLAPPVTPNQLSSKHVQPSRTASNSTSGPGPPPPSSSSKRQRVKPPVPFVKPSTSRRTDAQKPEEEDDDEFDDFPDELFASIELPPAPTPRFRRPGFPIASPALQAPLKIPNDVLSSSRVASLRTLLSNQASSPLGRDSSSIPSSSSRAPVAFRSHSSRRSPLSSSPSWHLEPPLPPPVSAPGSFVSHPPSSTAFSSSTAAVKLAKYRYVAPPLVEEPPPSFSAQSIGKAFSSSPPLKLPFSAVASFKSQPKPASRLPVRDVYEDEDDFFAGTVDPMSGYFVVKEEEVEGPFDASVVVEGKDVSDERQGWSYGGDGGFEGVASSYGRADGVEKGSEAVKRKIPRPSTPLPPPPPFVLSWSKTIHHLPASILHLILLYTISPTSLTNTAFLLVSKYVHSIARPILYRVVSLRSARGWNSFFAPEGGGSAEEVQDATSAERKRRVADYEAVRELEIHVAAPSGREEEGRRNMVLALWEIACVRKRREQDASGMKRKRSSSPSLLPSLTHLTLAFPLNSPTNPISFPITLAPFHHAFLKALSLPTSAPPSLRVTLIHVRNADQVRALFGTVQGVKWARLERPVDGPGRVELEELARGKGGKGRLLLPEEGEEGGWARVEKVEEWRRKSAWVGVL